MRRIGRMSGMSVRWIALSGLVGLAVALVGSDVLASGPVAVTAAGATFASTDAPAGLIVTSLETGGPAATAGLRVGDVIDRVDGRDAPTPDTFARAEAGSVTRLHVAARGDAGARTLLLHRPTEGQGEDPDRRRR
ncbi:MAG: PDZ domain-containing protein [Sphingomonas paucimobilis]